jgi:hypothetical protein
MKKEKHDLEEERNKIASELEVLKVKTSHLVSPSGNSLKQDIKSL